MIDRIPSGFHPFVLPFLFGMAFVLIWCLAGAIRIIAQLPGRDRRRFLLSLINPVTAAKNIRDIFLDCLIHVRLWKRNRMLGFMHSSIAFGWFMLIVLGHIEVILFVPERIHLFYYPIFFNYFVAAADETVRGSLLFFLMDFFLLLVLTGIALAMIKRIRSRWFGMRRTTRHSLPNMIGVYALWAIFPLRLLAESFTAHISGGSFLTIPANMLFRSILGNELHLLPTWWAYSIALCVFMVMLPFSRFMHIPAEMLLIPMRNAGLQVRSLRKGYAMAQVYSCPNCGVCIDACPMSVSKANLKDCTVYLTRQIRARRSENIERISDKCLLCGKCQALCQVSVDGPGLRILERSGRHYKVNLDFDSIDLQPLMERASGGKVLYFAGCMTQLTPAIGRSMESVLKKAGVDYVWMDRDGGLCCGRPLMTAGRKSEALDLVHANEQTILASGADTLVLSCPICYRIFREEYILPGVRVVHYSSYINELIREGRLKLKAPSNISYVYHDPCELGRGTGIYDEPRQLVSASACLLEAPKNRVESVCCGGSLGSLTLDFKERGKITRSSLDNLYRSGADAVATACPLCKNTFARYSDRPVKDIIEIIDSQTI